MTRLEELYLSWDSEPPRHLLAQCRWIDADDAKHRLVEQAKTSLAAGDFVAAAQHRADAIRAYWSKMAAAAEMGGAS